MEDETPGKGKPLVLTAEEGQQLAEFLLEETMDEELDDICMRVVDAIKEGRSIQVRR